MTEINPAIAATIQPTLIDQGVLRGTGEKPCFEDFARLVATHAFSSWRNAAYRDESRRFLPTLPPNDLAKLHALLWFSRDRHAGLIAAYRSLAGSAYTPEERALVLARQPDLGDQLQVALELSVANPNYDFESPSFQPGPNRWIRPERTWRRYVILRFDLPAILIESRGSVRVVTAHREATDTIVERRLRV